MLALSRRTTHEVQQAGGDAARRQVDVERPSPRDLLRQHTTHQRTDDRGDPPGRADQSGVLPSILHGDDVGDGDLDELDDGAPSDTLQRA